MRVGSLGLRLRVVGSGRGAAVAKSHDRARACCLRLGPWSGQCLVSGKAHLAPALCKAPDSLGKLALWWAPGPQRR